MPKARVYDLAKELGVSSKDVLNKLKDMGEFVKSASSTVEAPVVRKIKNAFAKTDSTVKKSDQGKKQATEPRQAHQEGAAGSGMTNSQAASQAGEQGQAQRQKTNQPHAQGHHADGPNPRTATMRAAMSTVNPSAQATVNKAEEDSRSHRHQGGASRSGQQRAGKGNQDRHALSQGQQNHRQTASGIEGGSQPQHVNPPHPHKPGTPRPGNNPFMSKQRMGTPTPGDIPRPHPMNRPGARNRAGAEGGRGGRGRGGRGGQGFASNQLSGRSGNRSGKGGRPGQGQGQGQGPRPGRNSHSSGQEALSRWSRQVGGNGAEGGRPGRFGSAAPGNGPGAGAPSRPAGGRGRGGRGGTAGAFGRQGGKSSKARKAARQRQRQEYEDMKAPVIGGVRIPSGNGQIVRLQQGATLSDLADKINVPTASLVTVLFHLGEMATATQSLDESTFQILGDEIGWKIQIVSAEEEDKALLQQFDIDLDQEDRDEDLTARPPVVTVMGHVDHGKTRLLDTIRQTNVSSHEAGGITQRIGAYQIHVKLNDMDRPITFLDTPGHEAFTAMRARGAELTDVAILVVAADDGVMPQTVEAINHAQAAHVPIVVAVNKIDVEGANPEKVRGQLTEYGLVPEEYGGDTMFVDISAKQGTNIDKLLEAVLLTADATLDLRANPHAPARGATVEARLDKGRGAVATVLVQQGTLHIGDAIVAGTSYGRVRAMLDENGQNLEAAPPSTPVAVLGLTSVPSAGDLFLVAPDDRSARQIAEKREAAERAAQLARRHKRVSLENLKEQFAKSEIDMLNVIIKGDSSGSVEALEDSLMKIDVSDEVGIQVIHRGVGAITQNDVNLATVDKAVIIGFNVRPSRQVSDLAEREGVEVRYYSVIYQAIEEIEASLKGMLKPEFEEVVTSHSEIREIFRSSKLGNIAGVMVQDGTVKRGTKARIMRNGIVTVNDLEITSLRRFKDDVQEVAEGYEAGINLGTFNDIEVGDIIETFEMQEVKRQ